MMTKYLKMARIFYRWTMTHKPTTAAIDVTSRCNLQCSHCYWWKLEHNPELSEEEMIKLMKKQRKDGIVCSILYGGEPTLRPEVCKAATEIFDTTMIFTNGTTGFTDLDCLWLVSLDGPKEIHDKIRGEGVYDKAIESIPKYTTPPIIHITISQLNKDHIEEFILAMIERPIMGIGFSFYTPNKGCEESELFIPLEERNAIIDELLVYRKKYGPLVGFTSHMGEIFKTTGSFYDWNAYNKCDVNMRCRCFSADGSRKPCTYGPEADCSRCGCAAIAVFRSSVRQLEWESFRHMLSMTLVALGK